MEPVPNMVNNPPHHLHAIQEKAFMEVILGVCYWKTTTFSCPLNDLVLECAHVRLNLSSLLHNIDRHEDTASDSLRKHTTRQICNEGLVLEEFFVQHTALKELITTKVEGCSWDRPCDVNGESAVQASHALLSHCVSDNLLYDLTSGDLGISVLHLLNLQLCFDSVDRM